MKKFRAMISYGVKKGIRYRANLYSWFLADIVLYFSVIVTYLMIFSMKRSIGGYNFEELAVYISTYFLINNLFAVFFSEGVSEYAQIILDGKYIYYQTMPLGVIKTSIMLNFNFPAMLSSPFLLGFNIFYVSKIHVSFIKIIMYYFMIACSVMGMLLLFLNIYSLLLYKIRSLGLSNAVSQILTIAEKPDTVFQADIRKIFTYMIPAFMFSAIPARFILGYNKGWFSVIYYLVWLLILVEILNILIKYGERVYESEVE